MSMINILVVLHQLQLDGRKKLRISRRGGGGWEALIFLGTKRTYEALRATQFLR